MITQEGFNLKHSLKKVNVTNQNDLVNYFTAGATAAGATATGATGAAVGATGA